MNSLGLYLYNQLKWLIPETKGFALKRSFLRLCGAKIEDNVRICSSVTILGSGRLFIGANTWIGHETMIISSSAVYIGSDVDIAPRVFLGTGTHIMDINSPRIAAKDISKNIIIGNGCWICANVLILPGVTIGDKSVIAAGAVVNRDVPSMVVNGGIPSVTIKPLS